MRGNQYLYRILCSFSVLTLCVYLMLMFSSDLFYKARNTSFSNNTSVLSYLHNLTNNERFTDDSSDTHEKSHVALLKVHKTGSSTVQNIFLRFADTRNLTLILAHDNKNLSETGYANVISYKQTLVDSNIVPPPEGRHYDLLCCHVIYNRSQFEKYLPKDTAYIGIVRDPISRTESAIRYFNLIQNQNLSAFAENPLNFRNSMIGNRMAFEFGFPQNLFPDVNDNYKNHLNLNGQIDMYLDKLFNEFDLIMVNERLSESLVMMKRILGWELQDIIYVNLNVAKGETRRFSIEDTKKLQDYLYLDISLYNRASLELQKKIDNEGSGFQDEVEHFLAVKESIKSYCQGSASVGSLEIKESKWTHSFTVTQNVCKKYKKFETHYIQDLRMRQYGRIDN